MKTTDSRSHLRRPLVRVEVHTKWLKLSSKTIQSPKSVLTLKPCYQSLSGFEMYL